MAPRSESSLSSPTLPDYVSVVRRSKWWVLTIIVVTTAVLTLPVALQSKQYRATATLLLRRTATEEAFATDASSDDQARLVATEVRVLRGRPMQVAAAAAYGAPVAVTARNQKGSDIVTVSSVAGSPEQAANQTNVYVATYQRSRRTQLRSTYLEAEAEANRQLDSILKQIDAVQEPLREIAYRKLITTDPDGLARLEDERQAVSERLAPQLDGLVAQASDYEQRLNLLQVGEKITTTGGVQIIQAAKPPRAPFAPKVAPALLRGLLLGVVLGLGVAFVRHRIDGTVASVQDLESVLPTAPVLGVVPVDTAWRRPEEARLTTLLEKQGPAAEAYRGLRTSLQMLAVDGGAKVVQVTSAQASEAKSTTVANTAVAFAAAGYRVVVVDCDLRRPRAHRFLGVDAEPGLTSVLLGELPLDTAVVPSPVAPGVDVLPSGPVPPNPSELLALDLTADLVRRLATGYDLVLLDSPPVLPVTDAVVLSPLADDVVLVVLAGVTTWRALGRSGELLHQASARVGGTVLVGVAEDELLGELSRYEADDERDAGVAGAAPVPGRSA